MFHALINFKLKMSLDKKEKARIYWQTIRKERSINDNNFEKNYKFKTNLLLSTKLINFFNFDEFSN